MESHVQVAVLGTGWMALPSLHGTVFPALATCSQGQLCTLSCQHKGFAGWTGGFSEKRVFVCVWKLTLLTCSLVFLTGVITSPSFLKTK